MAKDTFYFSHDYNARNDEKIKKLIRKHKCTGYGIYWCIVEDLYNNANALHLDYDGIAFDLHEDVEIVKSVINDFGLFVFDKKYFGSTSIERRLSYRDEKSTKARESAYKRWNKDNANVLQTHSERNAINKRKEIKEKKDIKFDFKKNLIDYGFEENLVNDWMIVRKNKKATNSETAFKSFIIEIEKIKKEKNEILKIIVSKSWQGFEAKWMPESMINEKSTVNFVSHIPEEENKW